MALSFFQIPARGCAEGEVQLNQFLQTHRVLTVDRRWVELAENSYWAICIDYLPQNTGSNDKSNRSRARIDYKEILSEGDFSLFSQLRDVRKGLASRDAVPVYAIATNEQLAKMVQLKVQTATDFKNVEGFGANKIEKYGETLLERLNFKDTSTTAEVTE